MTPFEQDTKGTRFEKETVTRSGRTTTQLITEPPTLRWFAFIHAERSDGEMLWVRVDVGEHEFDPPHISIALQNALVTLDLLWKDKEIETCAKPAVPKKS